MLEEKVIGDQSNVQVMPENCRALTPLSNPPGDIEPQEATVPLSHYLWIVNRHLWKIIIGILSCIIGTAIVSFRLTPIYESAATIDIDRRIPTGILGQEASQSITNDADQFM